MKKITEKLLYDDVMIDYSIDESALDDAEINKNFKKYF
jgi:hypothetical protein